MNTWKASLALASSLVLLLVLSLRRGRTDAEADARVEAGLGQPIPGLSDSQLDQFEQGREVFARRFRPSEGLGPHFNAASCLSCHEEPAAGGSAPRYRDFFLVAQMNAEGKAAKIYPDCKDDGAAGSVLCLPSMVVPHYGPTDAPDAPVSASVTHPAIPSNAAIVARRNAPPLFGIGLFRLVSDEEILSRADPDDSDGDGISGRVNRLPKEDNKIGRFGFKCQAATIEAFNRGALQNQMGITSDSTTFKLGDASEEGIFRRLLGSRVAFAQVSEPKDRIVDFDASYDPEIHRGELLDLVAFQENLAAPPRGAVTPRIARGETAFAAIGCASCHAQSLRIPSGLIHPYTDLLLHDMGPGLADGIPMIEASGSEFRTQPLWGLCRHAPFLHDGRADTVEQAILEHSGEAQASRERYHALDEPERQDLHRFLESL